MRLSSDFTPPPLVVPLGPRGHIQSGCRAQDPPRPEDAQARVMQKLVSQWRIITETKLDVTLLA
jgi:hypothetical protein